MSAVSRFNVFGLMPLLSGCRRMIFQVFLHHRDNPIHIFLDLSLLRMPSGITPIVRIIAVPRENQTANQDQGKISQNAGESFHGLLLCEGSQSASFASE